MILESFANYLKSCDPKTPASALLARWLWERLTTPAENMVDKMLRLEVEVTLEGGVARLQSKTKAPVSSRPKFRFKGRSHSGEKLLRSLYNFAQSYEQQKWSRFVHFVKASDFHDQA